MNAIDQKVSIKLLDTGSQREKVLLVLSKIQGLSDTPEKLVANVPCYISGKVPFSIAEKVKRYLEKAGAVIELEGDQVPKSVPSRAVDKDQLASSFDSLEYELTTTGEYKDSGSYEVTENSPMEEDITYFNDDSFEGSQPEETITYFHDDSLSQISTRPDTFRDDQEQAFETVRPVEAFYDREPPSRPVRRKRQRKKKRFNPRMILAIGLVIILGGLVGGGIWMYTSGRFARLSQQYEQSTVIGKAGILEIENAEGADVTLHHVIGTRVVEQILLEGTTAHLQRGDYYVEARKGSQILRYPVYIEGRGHRVQVTVSFPEKNLPEHMAYIPAGWFRMGNKETDAAHFGFPDEKPDIDVYVGAFLMSKYEVTNREYAQFVEAGGYEDELYWESLIEDWDSLTKQVPAYERVYGNDGWNSVKLYIQTRFIDTDGRPGPRLWEDDTPPYEYGLDDYPVLGITLYEAEAYCKWLTQKAGKVHRLPTEAEWEKAARGYEGYFFSYGNEYDPTRANTETEGPKKVGSYPPNGYGVHDLTGNVWEWVSDQYREDAYQFLYDTDKTDIRNPRVFDEIKRYERRIVRGGSFRSVNQINAKTTIRYPMFPNYWHTNIGFRYVTMP